MNYKADSNQVGFLQLLSTGAVQNITYHCKNSVGYFDASGKTFRKGLKLLGWNDAEILPRSNNQRLQYEVVEDTCRVSLSPDLKIPFFSTANPFPTMLTKLLFPPFVLVQKTRMGQNDHFLQN